MDIIKPIIDDNNYKYIILKNNIKCILINDNTLDKSYVVTNINTGSFADKEYYSGMAHLLEHMCFITSNKYREKNFLANKIQEYGGSVNAYTAEESTVYYFDVFTKNLELILEIFIDFLIYPELKKEYILNELKNVDSEHKKNINDDRWKLVNLERLLANKNSNFNNFYTGSSETLLKKDIYEKMIDFYKKYYHANNISVCIASNKSIDELLKISKTFFETIPKSNINYKLSLIKPIYTENKGKTFHMKCNSDIKILEYIFENKYEVTNKYNLVADILNSKETNSCNDYLSSLGLINSINSYYDYFGIFKIKIILTKKGLKEINKINKFIEFTINKILTSDLNQMLNYNKKKYKILFNNLEKLNTLDLCTYLITNLLHFKPEEIYIGPYLYNCIDIKDINKMFDFNNCIKIVVSKKFSYKKYLIDSYYNTKFTIIKLDNINKCNFDNKLIKYNINNNYININPNYIENLNNNIKCSKRIWFGNSSKFKEPIIFCSIVFSDKKYYCNEKNYLLTILSLNLLQFTYNKLLYNAHEFGYSVSLNSHNELNLIELQFNMYNDIIYIQQYIDSVLDFNNFDISDELINLKKSIMIDSINSISKKNPWSYNDYIFNSLYKQFYMYDILLVVLKEIKPNEVRLWCNDLFKTAGSYVIVFGNIDKKNIPNFDKLEKNFKLPLVKFDTIKMKKHLIVKHPYTKECSNCIKISYFIGEFEPLNNLHLFFIKLIASSIFFEDLRTTKQLGYLVSMYGSSIDNKYYIYQKIQSLVPCNQLIKYINEFNSTLIDKFKVIDLTSWIETVKNHLTEKPSNLSELYNEYYGEILNQTCVFDKKQQMLKQLNKVTNKSLCEFINKYILKNSNKIILEIIK